MQRICTQCSAGFTITDEDLAFYDKVSPVFNGKKEQIPPPTLCPDCRSQRRMMWRNERTLYNRTCELCKRMRVSAFAQELPFHTFCKECLYGDGWDPLSCGRPYDFSKDFRTNFCELMHDVPMMMLHQSGVNENCEYINFAGTGSKNCYLIFNSGRSEDCYYARGILESKDCMDILIGSENQLCYELINCHRCYTLFFSQNCSQCTDSAFLFNCQSCSHCFGCTNLVQKEYYLFNKPCTPEEYQSHMSRLSFASFIQEQRDVSATMRRSCVHRATNNINAEDCTGDYITASKNCLDCFEVKGAEDCKWLTCSRLCKDSYDLFGYGYDSSLLYENTAVGLATSTAFSFTSDSCNDCYCCLYSQNIKNCFGCISIRHKQYCIFNTQYTKEEYEVLVPKIIAHMRESGDWGEYLHAELSPFAYNETIAQEYFPLTQEEVVQRTFRWREMKEESLEVQKLISADQLPDSIEEIPDDMLQWAITCEATGKPFRIIKQELDFYRRMHLALPRRHPDARHYDRLAQCNPHVVWSRPCDHCKKPMQTTYAPDRLEIVYCESCYLESVY